MLLIEQTRLIRTQKGSSELLWLSIVFIRAHHNFVKVRLSIIRHMINIVCQISSHWGKLDLSEGSLRLMYTGANWPKLTPNELRLQQTKLVLLYCKNSIKKNRCSSPSLNYLTETPKLQFSVLLF